MRTPISDIGRKITARAALRLVGTRNARAAFRFARVRIMLDRPGAASVAENLAWLSAEQQLDSFRRGLLSPVDVLRAQIERIERDGSALNAVTYDHFDEAMAAARTCEDRYRNGSARPLEGITVAVKDEYAKTGWVVTAGSKLFK